MKTNHAIIFCTLLFTSHLSYVTDSFAGNYAWNGTSSQSWTNTANWTPNGNPSTSDTITISTNSGTYNLLLTAGNTVYRLVLQNDSIDLGGYTLTVSNSSSFTGGYIANGTLDLRGNNATFSGTYINTAVSAACSSVYFNGSTFNQAVTADVTSNTTNTSNGGNIFNNRFEFFNSGKGVVNFSNTTRNYYNGAVIISDTGSRTVNFAISDTSFFNGDIYVNSGGVGVLIGGTSGYAQLASGKVIAEGSKGFRTGSLVLNNFIQLGNTSQTLSFGGNAIINFISAKFNGNVNYTAPGIIAKNSSFFGGAYFTKTDSVSNVWYGGNNYSGVFRFSNSGSGSVQMQTSSADIFADSVTLNSGSALFKGCITNTTVFNNSLFTTGSNIDFSTGDGICEFGGSANQVIKGSVAIPFSYINVNKSSGTLTLQTPVSISGTLNLVSGIIESDSTNLLTLLRTSSCYYASNASFVSGPVKKIGNAAFIFPIGKGNSMSVAGISAPANGTDAFTAEYFEGANPLGNTLDSLLTSISNCGYWKIARTNGTSNVKVTLGWDSLPCLSYCDTNVKIAVWKNSKWQQINIDTVTTNTNNYGRFISSSNVSDYSYFLIANVIKPLLSVYWAASPRTINDYFGLNVWDVIENENVTLNPDPTPPIVPIYQDNVFKLSPATLRFPAAVEANWWDWKKGGFIKDRKIGNNMYYLPEQFQDEEQKDALISGLPANIIDFFTSVYSTGCTPIFSLNDLSSDVLYQGALIYHARQNNIPVQLMELGGEVYKEADYNNITFPTGTDYAKASIEWGKEIKELYHLGHSPNTGNFQIALNAARFNPFVPTERVISWNKKMFDEIDDYNTNQNPTDPFHPDAIIIHNYLAETLGSGIVDKCTLNANSGSPLNIDYYKIQSPFGSSVCTKDMNLIFSGTFRNMFGERNINDYKGLLLEELNPSSSNDQKIPAGYDIWITEYNSNENFAAFHGSWAHGLSAALQTMLYLESDRITKVNCYKIIGDAVYSAIFGSDDGFGYNRNSPEIYEGNMPTTPGTFTSVGLTMGLLAKAMRNADYTRPLSFTGLNTPRFTTYERYGSTSGIKEPMVYGWYFTDSLSNEEQMVILNLSNQEVALDMSHLPISSGGSYEQIYCDPSLFVTDGISAFNVPNGHILVNEPPASIISPFNIPLKPYSIMRIFKYNCSVTVKALADKVCAGTTSSVKAFGDEAWTYNWSVSTTDVTLSTPDNETPTGSTIAFTVGANASATKATFTVTVTSSGCGTFTQSVSIDISPKPSLIVTDQATTKAAENRVVCTGGSMSWDALFAYTGPSSPAWYHCILINSNGEGVAESDQVSTTLNFDVDTTAKYYIYAYDDNCAVEWGPVEIAVPWINLGGDLYVCNGTTYVFTEAQIPDFSILPGYSGATYSWDDGGGIVSTSAHPAFAVTTTTTYTVTVTVNTNTTCTLTSSITLYPVTCCTGGDATFDGGNLSEFIGNADIDPYVDDPPNEVTDNGTVIVDASALGATPLEIAINGKLFINEFNLRLINCHIIMSEAAEIVVDRHLVLTLEGTIIEGCATTNMWKGIRLMESATIRTDRYLAVAASPPNPAVWHYNEINDAQYAISCTDRSRVFLDNFDASEKRYLTFRRNYVALYLPPITGKNVYDVDFRLSNLVVTGELAAMKDPYIDQTPAFSPGSQSYSGFLLNNFAGVVGIGIENKARIEFLQLNNGIIAYNSSLLVTNSTFADIQPYDPGTGANGSAIFVHGDNKGSYSLIQTGLGKTNITPTFTNCRVGILGYHTAMNIKENKMSGVETGISMINNNYRTNVIYNNNVSCTRFGIRSAFNDHAFTIINFNKITLNPGTGSTYTAAINIDENGFSTNPKQLFVYGNDPITITTGLNAIALNNTQNSQVYANNITLAGNSNTVSGMRMNTCREGNVHDNTVTGSGASGNQQRAFNVYSTILTQLHKNTMNATEIGMYYDEPCNDTWMTCNEMQNHNYGDKVDDGGFFDHKHKLALNTWTGTYGTWGFEFLSSGGVNPFANIFEYNINDANSWPPSPNDFTPNGFFITTNDVATDDCEDYNGPIGLTPVFNDFDYEIAAQTLEREYFEDEYNYIAKSNLYYKASLYPDSIPAESAIDSFYFANQYTTIGLFRELDKQAASFFMSDSSAKATINYNDSVADFLLSALALNDSILYDTIPDSDSLDIVEENVNLKSSLYSIIESDHQLMTILDSLSTFYADSILTLNSVISVSNTIEENQKIINEIYYSTISRGIFEFDSAQTANIFEIATQCPESGGKAVPIAQAIYRLIVDTVTFANDTNCGGASPRLAKVIKEKGGNSYIYPNPTSNSATLKFSLSEKQNGWFVIYDVLSREIERFHLEYNMTEYEFKCANLYSGLYFYSITSEEKIVDYGKFNVLK
jgi:hypothetical protein